MQEVKPPPNMQDIWWSKLKVWAFCLGCGHSDRLDPRRYMRVVRPIDMLSDFAKRLRCSRCRSKRVVCHLDDPNDSMRHVDTQRR